MSTLMKIIQTPGSAIFLDEAETYHADRCEPLVRAVSRGDISLYALARRGYPGNPIPARMLPELSTVGFWDATAKQSWGLGWHRNEGIEFTYLSRGRLDFAVDGHEYPLESGHLTITRPWQLHRVGNPQVGASRLHWLILDVGVRRPNQRWQWPDWLILSPTELHELTDILRHNERPVWKVEAAIGHCFERIAALVANPRPPKSQTQLQLRLNELLLTLLEMLQLRRMTLDRELSTTRRMVELFLASLPDHLAKSWTLDEMANQCGLGRTRFADYCRRITNVAPVEYLLSCRVDAARRMLLTDPLRSVSDIGFACGFQSSQYFATVFHHRTGCSPRAYRKRGLAEKASSPNEPGK